MSSDSDAAPDSLRWLLSAGGDGTSISRRPLGDRVPSDPPRRVRRLTPTERTRAEQDLRADIKIISAPMPTFQKRSRDRQRPLPV